MKLGIGLPNTMAHETDRKLMLDWARLADEAGFHVLGTIELWTEPENLIHPRAGGEDRRGDRQGVSASAAQAGGLRKDDGTVLRRV